MNGSIFDKAALRKGASSISKQDAADILSKKNEVLKKSRGPLTKFIGNIKILFQLLNDYVHGRYTRVPWAVIAMIAFSLLYVLNPIDLIPDFIPVFGLLDDAACLAVCLSSIDSHLRAYTEWRQSKDVTADTDGNNA